MTGFASKASPSEVKLRGGYYTPEAVAEFLARWVSSAGGALLEPSCGNGAIVRHLVRHARGGCITGIERDPAEATAAAIAAPAATIVAADFFQWFRPSEHGRWDGVAGNPPYLRFGNWPEADRAGAMDLLQSAGLKPSRLTNAWVPFTVAAVLATREGGHVGLVLPAELLQVSYAKQLRDFLVTTCSSVRVVTFAGLLFENVLQEVVLLLAVKGHGPAMVSTVEVDDPAELPGVAFTAPRGPSAALADHEKWTKYFLAPAAIEALRWARTDAGLARLGEYASVDVGVVSGRNAFFTMTEGERSTRRLEAYCVPLVSRSIQLSGVVFDERDFEKQRANDARCWLLALDGDGEHAPALAAYLESGETADVHTGYKCRIRPCWWVVPSTWVPDAFMLRQLHTHPRIVANETAATSTDTVHRVRLSGSVDTRKLAAAVINSATFASAEVVGRSYGGGILELEPTEAENLLIPPPDLVPDDLPSRVDALVRDGAVDVAADLVDRVVLMDQLHWTAEQVSTLKDAWVTLRNRRRRRARRATRARGAS